MRYFLFSLVFLFSFLLKGQQFIGEQLSLGKYEYIKLDCKNDTCNFSIPYLDGRKKYLTNGNPLKDSHWSIKRGIEKWEFETTASENSINGKMFFSNHWHSVELKRQFNPIRNIELKNFIGEFVDPNGAVALVYQRFGFLHFISPYTELTVGLKPLGPKQFWNIGGEHLVFKNENNGVFQSLEVSNRLGEKINLVRKPKFKVKKDWLVIEGDSIYFELFIPKNNKPLPAVLILPGGGNQSQIENFSYEARFFAANDVVAMTFDKVGVGKSTGANFDYKNFIEKMEVYESVFDYLSDLKETDKSRIGLHGSSEGGRLVLMMSIHRPDKVAFTNAVSAPIMTTKEGQLYASNHYNRNSGVSEEDLVNISFLWNNYYDGIIRGEIDTSQFEELRKLHLKYPRAFLPPVSAIIPRSPSKEDLSSNYITLNSGEIRCPLLLQYGENDQRVDPYRSIGNLYESSISKELIEIIIYNRANHSFMTPEFQISQGYLQDKLKWLKSLRLNGF